MKVIPAVLLALFVGFWAFAGLVSDLGPGETEGQRWAYLSAVFLGGGLLVGLLAERRWWLAVLCAWTPLLRLATSTFHGLRGSTGQLLDVEAAGHVIFAAGLALLGGFVGWVIRRRTRKAA